MHPIVRSSTISCKRRCIKLFYIHRLVKEPVNVTIFFESMASTSILTLFNAQQSLSGSANLTGLVKTRRKTRLGDTISFSILTRKTAGTEEIPVRNYALFCDIEIKVAGKYHTDLLPPKM